VQIDVNGSQTVAAIPTGLLPILFGGGMVSAPLPSMFVVPTAWLVMRRRFGSALKSSICISVSV
jgi:hypothetical protein